MIWIKIKRSATISECLKELSLRRRHNEPDGVSYHQPRHWPVTGEFPAQIASNAENVSIWCRHNGPCLDELPLMLQDEYTYAMVLDTVVNPLGAPDTRKGYRPLDLAQHVQQVRYPQ